MRTIITLLACAALFPSAAIAERDRGWISVNNGQGYQAEIAGSGHRVTQVRPITDFRELQASGIANVHVRVGGTPSLTITADDNLLPYLRTTVANGVLHVGDVGSFRTRTAPEVYVTVPNLQAAVTDGSGDISLEGVNSARLDLVTQGSGDITAQGRTGDLRVKLEGSGDADLRNLQAASADVGAMGSGDAWVGTNGAVTARSDGSGDVYVIGRPAALRVSEGGSGRVIVRR